MVCESLSRLCAFYCYSRKQQRVSLVLTSLFLHNHVCSHLLVVKRKKAVQKGEIKVEIELSDEQKQEITKIFETMSVKVTSNVTGDEIQTLADVAAVVEALQSLGYDATTEDVESIIKLLREEYIQKGMMDKEILEQNGGRIDMETFLEIVKRKIQRDEMMKAFESVDYEGSGRLNAASVLAALKALGFSADVTLQDIEQYIAQVAGAGEQTLNFDEFVRFVAEKLQEKTSDKAKEVAAPVPVVTKSNPKAELLNWMSDMLESFTGGQKISDFTKSWQDGKLLSSLVYSLVPKSVKAKMNLNETDPLTLTETAIRIAEEELGIPMIVDPVDVVNNPEELSMMTYFSYFRDYVNERGSEEEEEEEVDPELCSVQLVTNKRFFLTGEEITFKITAVSTDGELRVDCDDQFEVCLSGPAEIESTATSNNNGTYNFTCVATVAGDYKPYVTINGVRIENAPSKITVKYPVSATHSTISGMEETIIAGFTTEFTIQSKSKDSENCTFGGHNFNVVVVGPTLPVEAKLVDLGDGTYNVNWLPQETGTFNVNVGDASADVDQSPYFVLVRKQVAPRNCVAQAACFTTVVRPHESTSILIQTKDENGNDILTGSERVKIEIVTSTSDVICPSVKDNSNGTYEATFALEKPGDYVVTITVNDQPIKGSPFGVTVEPELYAPSTVACLDDTVVKPDGCTIRFNVQPLDKFDNVTKTPANIVASVLDENNNQLETKIIECNGDNFAAFFKPRSNKYNYQLALSVNNTPLKNSPIPFALQPTIDPALCTVEGPGLEGGDLISRLGFPAIFTIYAKDIDGNDMPAGEDDKVNIPINQEIIKRFYNHQDTPVVPPTMEKSKTRRNAMKREEDLGHPANPMNYKYRYTDRVVEISEEEVTTQNILWEDPDEIDEAESSSAIYEVVDLERLDRQKQASPFVVRIVTENADEEDIEIQPYVLKSGASEYTVMYTTTYAGLHTISIQYDEQDVVGSPFQAIFTAGIDPRRCNMMGTGAKKAYVKVRTCFDIYAVDQDGRQKKAGGDDFEVVIKDPTGTSIKEPVTVDDRGDGTYKCYYTPQMEGPHTIKVKCKGVELPNSSVKIMALSQSRMPDVKKAKIAPATSVIYAKTPTFVTVTLPDMNIGGDNVEAEFITPLAGLTIKKPVIKDNANGTYSIFYEAPVPGLYKCKVTVNNEPVSSLLELPVVADINPTVSTIGNWNIDISSASSLDQTDIIVDYKGYSNLSMKEPQHFKLNYDAPTNEEEIDEMHTVDVRINERSVGGAPFRQTFGN